MLLYQAEAGGRVREAGDPVQETRGRGSLPRHPAGAPHHPATYLAVRLLLLPPGAIYLALGIVIKKRSSENFNRGQKWYQLLGTVFL